MTRVSVVLPVYNGAAYLRRAIDSVLAQTLRDFELLVVDDGSTDGSGEIAASYADPRIRVLRNAGNAGLARALNRGLEEARAPLVARQDADDVSQPERLARQTAFLDAHPDVVLVGAQAWEVDAAGRRVGVFDKACEPAGIAWTMLLDNAFIHTTVMFRRDAVRAAGGYDPEFAYCQDYELWSRLLRSHRAANLPERLASCLLHAGSMTETVQSRYRHQSLDVMAREQQAHLGRTLAADEAERLARIRAGIPAPEKARVLEALDAMRADFLRRRPEADRSPDFRRTIARQYGNVLAAHRFQPLGLIPQAAARLGWRYPVLATVARRAYWAARHRIA